MQNLDDRKKLLEIDKSNALLSIEQLPQQCEQAWKETNALTLPEKYTKINSIVVCGMGASWLGAHIMQGLLSQELKVPLLVTHDYTLPQFVNKSTLVIASSYSGTTEETVAALESAHQKGAKIITISTGGTLETFARDNNLPHYTFTGTFNPAASPRLGLGYSIVAQIVLLTKLGLVSVAAEDIETTIRHLRIRASEFVPENSPNEAKQMAESVKGYMPIVVAGGFLLGNAHVFANQFNETAKTFATFMHIPELNHHLMEGLAHPNDVKKLKFIFLESNLYDERVQTRFTITKEVIQKNKIAHVSYKPGGTSKILQSFDTLLFGSFVTYYLAMLYDVDPSPNPWVDYFKKRLKEANS